MDPSSSNSEKKDESMAEEEWQTNFLSSLAALFDFDSDEVGKKELPRPLGNTEEKMGVKLFRAAMNGEVKIFDKRKKSDQHVFRKACEKHNILHIAIRYEQKKFVRAYLNKYFEMNKKLISERNLQGNTPLHVAAEVGNIDIVYLLYDYLEESVNEGDEEKKPWRAQNKEGNTALHLALLYQKYNVARYLVKRDAGLARILNHSLESPLHLAITQLSPLDKDCQSMVSILLDIARFVASWPDSKGMTPLLRAAASRGPYDILQITDKIIDECPESTLVCDASGNSFLHLLVRNTKLFDDVPQDEKNEEYEFDSEKIEDLICRKEIRILKDYKDKDGNTPSHIAAQCNNIHMVRTLGSKCSANFDIRNNDGMSARSGIEQQNWPSQPRSITPEELISANKGDIFSLEQSIKPYGQIGGYEFYRSQDYATGSNLLHFLMNTTAIRHVFSYHHARQKFIGFIENALFFIGKVVCDVDKSGDTPIHILVRNKDLRRDMETTSLWESGLLSSLLSICFNTITQRRVYGIDFKYHHNVVPPWVKQNAKGNTPLHEAIIANNKVLVLQLLSYSQESAHLLNKNNETPLHLLAATTVFGMEEFTDEEIVKMVNANIEALGLRDKDGLIPILRALKAGNLNMVVTLLSNGQKIDDTNGQIFWNLLINHKSNNFVNGLLGNEVFRKMLLELKDKDGNTPFHVAMKEKSFGFVENILEIYGRKGELSEGVELEGNQWLVDVIRTPDNEGLTPIIRAIKVDNLKLARALCHEAPEAAFVGDSDGKTFWHLLIKHPLYNSEDVKDLLKTVELREMLKQKDKDGVTPLHLAIKEKCFSFVQLLLAEPWGSGDESDQSSKGNQWPMNLLRIPNNVGETPEDLLADLPTLSPQLEKKLLTDRRMKGIRSSWRIPRTQLQNYMNSMNVIAALQTTITFTAAFAIPGGLIQDIGTPLLIQSIAFQIFMISDVIAMCLSMMVLICLLWMVATDKRKSVMIQDFAVTLLLASFVATLITFMAGVCATIFPVKRWIAIFTLVLCSFLMLLVHRFMITNMLLPFKNATSNFVHMLFRPAAKTIKKLKGDVSRRNIV